MKKILAIVLSIVMIFSMSAVAFAEDAAPEADNAAALNLGDFDLSAVVSQVKGIFDQVMSAIQTQGVASEILKSVQDLVNKILAAIGVNTQSSVLGAVSDLEAKIGDLGIIGDIFEYIHNLINKIKQKIKNFYAGFKETTCEATAAEAPAETGSTSLGIVAFAAVSVAAAAAYVCTRKKED
ncbi:MAG: hypothetical protein J5870_07565 [Clostridia bacterium]|nr:hypothetical protein [Clostridia bacterium]MBR5772213.1 hypothetical protein [Clostridia bacterium]